MEPVLGTKSSLGRAAPLIFIWLFLVPRIPSETFEVELFLSEYPMEAPEVYFVAINRHTDLAKLGRIHLDVLKGK